MSDRSYRFASFELFPDRGMLLNDGNRVALGSRALAILALLVERSGELVSSQDIMERVWPGVFVDESNLRVQVASLRKALGESRSATQFLVTESGRGYRFLLPVLGPEPDAIVGEATTIKQCPVEPPLLFGALVGRTAAIASISTIVGVRRLVTLTGPGGIGKTSLALAVLEQLRRDYAGQICFVDLTTLTDPSRVSNELANALHLPNAGDTLPVLLKFLQQRRMLVVLDNCEHVVIGVAGLVEALLTRCAAVTIFTTSREPLRVAGEVLYKVEPLTVPPSGSPLSPAQVLSFSAVELFAERASSADQSFEVTEENAEAIGHICHQLDGLPLALELAAASVGSLGVSALISGLDDRLSLLTQGSRTTRRHETLRAMLDWSLDLLTDEHRDVFACLSVFRTAFPLNAAISVLGTPTLGRAEIIQAIQHLVSKSLLISEPSATGASYRMLVTSRAYAAEILSKSEKRIAAFERHADYVLKVLGQARIEWRTRSFGEWWGQHGRLKDDVEAALDWAFSPEGDDRVGVNLTLASGPLWIGRSFLGEFFGYVRKAIERLGGCGLIGGREEMMLQVSLGHILFAVEGPTSAEIAACSRALSLAENIGDPSEQITALWGLCGSSGVLGRHEEAMALSERMIAVSQCTDEDDEARAVAKRMQALSHFRLGHFAEARRIGENLIAHETSEVTSLANIYQYDQITATRANLSATLWIQGHVDRAIVMIEGTVEAALERRNPQSLVYILSHVACPIALWCGRHDLASRYIKQLAQHAEANAFIYMGEFATRYGAILAARIGHRVPFESRSIGEADFQKMPAYDRQLFISVQPDLIDEDTAGVAQRGETNWATAEMVRTWGEQRLAQNPSLNSGEASTLFETAISIAGRQGALSWELRAATSLARLKLALAEPEAALAVLAPVLDRFKEGFGTSDLRAAVALKARLEALI